MKPVRLPASATLALPRFGIFALCLLYILPGLIGRDPWKIGGDAAGFGLMWTMAHGTWQDWLWPHIAALPMPQEGPLSYWIGALCIRILGWLIGDATAARVASLLFFTLGAMSVWYATYALGRRQEAQPVQLAFGGQPEPRDFGRTLADGALLIYLGSLGLLIHSHLTSAVALQISLVAFVLLVTVHLFDNDPKRPISTVKHAAIAGLGLGLLVLTRGWLVPLTLWATCLIIAAIRYKKRLLHLLAITLPVAMAIVAIWVASCTMLQPFHSSPVPAWMSWNLKEFFHPNYSSLIYFIKYSAWFTWPAWPFAGWAIYAWRKQMSAIHIALPLGFLIALVLLAFCSPAEQNSLIPLIPPLSILAAFGLPTMKRGAINAVDWFSVIAFSIFAVFIWLSWFAMQIGWPEQLRNNVFKTAPGFIPQFDSVLFFIAFVTTCAWLKLVYWRISRQPQVLWRAVVLSGSGVILCWLLALTLFTPWIDYRVSYRSIAREIASHLPAQYNCVDTNTGPNQRASFAYFGKIRFARINEKNRCEYFLAQRHMQKPVNYPTGQPFWQGRRAADKTERFMLFKRGEK